MITQELLDTFVTAGAGVIAGQLAAAMCRRVMHWSRPVLVGLAEATIARLSPTAPRTKERKRP
ncbi:hypothetical protein ACFWYW_46910 [Nonomuraea sp. NPDC059023]|uniref:hypothetical protein n=1 Tax=unclassified Nonomuraea TaxID=2593643 RepID=UPI0036776AA0